MPSEKIRILVVDDCEENLRALSGCLSPGYAVTTARSGEDALKLLSSDRFALILLDVRMGIDGLQTATLIRESESTADIPIIFLTAYESDADQILEGYQLGGVDFIQRPFSPQVLMAKVAVFAELHRKQQQAQNLAAASMKLVEKTQTLADTFLELEEAKRHLSQPCQVPFAQIKAEQCGEAKDIFAVKVADGFSSATREIVEILGLLLASDPTPEQVSLLRLAKEAAGRQLEILDRMEREQLS